MDLFAKAIGNSSGIKKESSALKMLNEFPSHMNARNGSLAPFYYWHKIISIPHKISQWKLNIWSSFYDSHNSPFVLLWFRLSISAAKWPNAMLEVHTMHHNNNNNNNMYFQVHVLDYKHEHHINFQCEKCTKAIIGKWLFAISLDSSPSLAHPLSCYSTVLHPAHSQSHTHTPKRNFFSDTTFANDKNEIERCSSFRCCDIRPSEWANEPTNES